MNDQPPQTAYDNANMALSLALIALIFTVGFIVGHFLWR